MPITLQTKFDVGDVVWQASTVGKRRSHPCPDCLGVRRWQAISPAGYGYTFECPRCSQSYISERALDLGFFQYEPMVTRETLVEFYGMRDGVGGWFGAVSSSGSPGSRSGTILMESSLFATEIEAREAAKQMAFDATDRHQRQPPIASQRELRLRVCDYQLHTARQTASEIELSRASYKTSDFLDALQDALDAGEDADFIRGLISGTWPERGE